jgi:transcriptional regulator with XRE-family HTH domain
MVNVEFLNKLKGKTSQRDLAKNAGVSFASIQRAQKGKAGLIVLRALSKYFNVPLATLLKDNGS